MKRVAVWITIIVAAVVLVGPAGGCSKEEPRSIGEMRRSHESRWRDTWQNEREREAAAAVEAEAAQVEKPPEAPPTPMQREQQGLRQSLPAQYPEGGDTPDGGEDPEAEADKDMPGEYK
jgi:hypothetical protein